MASNVALTGLASELGKRASTGKPIRIGLIGSGEMGTDIVTRASLMSGIDVAAIADVRVENATRAVDIAFAESGHSRVAKTTDALNAAMEDGKVGVVSDANLLLESGMIDVVIEATGLPGVGAELGLKAMELGKHLVMMNVEADITIGSYLKAQADRLGVVYSLGAGDEPSSCMELIEFVTAMGHKVVSAGKGKNNPLNFNAVPHEYQTEADSRHMNSRMLVEFVDGTKTMVEMAAIANATGLIPDKPGMHGPASGPQDLAKTLIPEKDGGVLSDIGRVDFSVGRGVAPGVFVVVEAQHPRIWERMKDLKMGDGPYFSFLRPYHLTSLEVPLTCAKAVLHGKADMVPLDKPVAEVCALAKKDLAVGELLDQIGEYCYRGWIMEATEAKSIFAIPCGLLAGSIVTKPIRKGELITYDNTTPPKDSKIVQLRALQDQMIFGG
jgi:predicted homoserine dehydrogenase-like protein